MIAQTLSSYELMAFRQVAESGNISHAARRIGMTQPALSLLLRRMEQLLGIELMLRSRRGIQLTRAGTLLLNSSRDLLQHWDKVRTCLHDNETEVTGRYTIGAHPALALRMFPLFTGALLKTYPKLELNFAYDFSRKITDRVIDFSVDFGFVINPIRHPDLTIVKLHQNTVTVWDRKEKSNGSDVIICNPEMRQTEIILRQLTKRNPKRLYRLVYSSDLSVIAELTSAGVGLGIIPGSVAELQWKKRLVRVKDAPLVHDDTCLIYRKDAQASAAGKKVLATIRAGVKRNYLPIA